MVTMVDGRGNTVDIDYDDEHDTTQWESRDDQGNVTGGGQKGGDAVDEIVDDYEGRGFEVSHSG